MLTLHRVKFLRYDVWNITESWLDPYFYRFIFLKEYYK